jgi:hypothetical protein
MSASGARAIPRRSASRSTISPKVARAEPRAPLALRPLRRRVRRPGCTGRPLAEVGVGRGLPPPLEYKPIEPALLHLSLDGVHGCRLLAELHKNKIQLRDVRLGQGDGDRAEPPERVGRRRASGQLLGLELRAVEGSAGAVRVIEGRPSRVSRALALGPLTPGVRRASDVGPAERSTRHRERRPLTPPRALQFAAMMPCAGSIAGAP